MLGRGIAVHFLRPRHLRWGWGVSTTPLPLYPLYRRLCGSQGRSGCVRNISPHQDTFPGQWAARSESLYQLSYPRRQTLLGLSSFCCVILNFLFLKHFKIANLLILYLLLTTNMWLVLSVIINLKA